MKKTCLFIGGLLLQSPLIAGGLHWGVVDALRGPARMLREETQRDQATPLPLVPLGTATASPTQSPSFTVSPTFTASRTGSHTATASPTGTSTVTLSSTPSATATVSPTHSSSPTGTPSQTASGTPSATPTVTLTATGTPTSSGSPTPSATKSSTPTCTYSPTSSPTPSATLTRTVTATPAGTATTVPTPLPAFSPVTLNNPTGLALDPVGNMYVSCTNLTVVKRLSPNGAVGTDANIATSSVNCIALDPAGNKTLYFVAASSNSVKAMDLVTNSVVTAMTLSESPYEAYFGSNGHLYFTLSSTVVEMTTTGTLVRTYSAPGAAPWGIAIDGGGLVYSADFNNHAVVYFQADGTYLGSFGSANVSQAQGVAYFNGGIYVGDGNPAAPKVCKFTFNGTAWVFQSSQALPFPPANIAAGPQGHIYYTTAANNTVGRLNPF